MGKRHELKIIVWLTVMLLIINYSLALGLGPVQIFKIYEPGKTDKIELTVFNNENKEGLIDVSVRGELKDFIEFNKTLFLKKNQEQTKVIFYLTHPQALSGGAHYAQLVITESTGKDSTVSAVQSYVSKLRLQVPMDEKYAEAKLIIIPGSTTNFNIDVFNYGKEDIDASAKIEIYKKEKPLQELFTNNVTIASLKQDTLKTSARLDNGLYSARAVVDYGKTIELEENFIVGKPSIEIKSIAVDPFAPHEVAKINIKLMTDWEVPIENVKGEITIVKDNTYIETITTETFTIFKEHELTAFWENKGPGNFSAKLNILYNGEVVSKDFELVTSKKTKNSIFIILILIVLLLILIAEILREINHGGPIIRYYRIIDKKTREFYSKVI